MAKRKNNNGVIKALFGRKFDWVDVFILLLLVASISVDYYMTTLRAKLGVDSYFSNAPVIFIGDVANTIWGFIILYFISRLAGLMK